jgi:carbonic anhydrase/acetyltransferase-like protein (isoleucine patch superfamily)
MKAYLIRNAAALPPFQKPASQVRLRDSTVGSRLRAQLTEIGCEVVDVDVLDQASIAAGSLVLQDDLMMSSRLLRVFLSAIPDRRRSYRCEIDTARFTFTCLSEMHAPSAYRALPLQYVGDDCDAQAEPLRMTPGTLLELARELPARVDQIEDMRAYVVDYYGIQLEHWFDLLTATGLYCREFAADRLRPFHSLLPQWLMTRVTSWSWFRARQNSIGKRTRIHPTAILEGCVVGDDVVIGPFAYLRSSVIGSGAVIRERSTVTMAFVGGGAFVMGGDVANTYLGSQTAIFAPALYNVVFGERGLLGGAGGFADFLIGSGAIVANIAGAKVPSNLVFLGSAVGDDCFVGTNMIFAPGQTIPDGTKVFDHALVKFHPTTPDGAYVVAGSDVIQVPGNFLGSALK